MSRQTRIRGGRQADVSPAAQPSGGSQTALPEHPTTITRDCDCGSPGDVVLDGTTLCSPCFLNRIRPTLPRWRSRIRSRRFWQ